jgi:pimeloyl-ACP methyl ester carboxylesterase
LESGQGDVVLMIHGGNSFAAGWAPLIQPLSREFHLYLPDRPGCGLTDKRDYRGVSFREHSVAFVKRLLDRIGLERVSLVGNSMGGFFALSFALAHPERVVKIAVIGAAPLINDAMPVPHRLLSVPGLNRFIWSRLSARAAPPRALFAQPQKLRPEAIACARVGGRLPGAVKSWLTMVEQVGTLAGFRARYNLKSEMKNIRMPCLFIQGDKDGFATVASVQRVQEQMPHSQLEVVPNAGHLPWYDEPEHCVRALQQFLRK